jgi:putative transposase
VTALERLAPRRVIGVDLDVVCPVMTSDGEALGVTPPSPRLEKLAKRAQGRMDQNTPESRGWCKWRKTLKRHRRRSAAEIRRQLHEAAKQLADSARLVRMEDLNLQAMTARGKVATDGESRTSSSKGRAGRRLRDVPKYEFRRIVGYKLEARGGRLELVSAAYTSQQCHRCGHIDKRNRVTRSEFRCQRCGHTDHADLNAAKNIRDSGADVAFRPEAERDLLFGLESRSAANRPASKPHGATKIAGRCDRSDASKPDSSLDGSDVDPDLAVSRPSASGPFRN